MHKDAIGTNFITAPFEERNARYFRPGIWKDNVRSVFDGLPFCSVKIRVRGSFLENIDAFNR